MRGSSPLYEGFRPSPQYHDIILQDIREWVLDVFIRIISVYLFLYLTWVNWKDLSLLVFERGTLFHPNAIILTFFSDMLYKIHIRKSSLWQLVINGKILYVQVNNGRTKKSNKTIPGCVYLPRLRFTVWFFICKWRPFLFIPTTMRWGSLYIDNYWPILKYSHPFALWTSVFLLSWLTRAIRFCYN